MNKLIVGIVAKEIDYDGKHHFAISKDNIRFLKKKCILFSIINQSNNKLKFLVSMCDGIIIPGGKIIPAYYYKILEYAIESHIPILGICLGCQLLALSSNNDCLIKVPNHNFSKNHQHAISIVKDSLLYKLFGSKIMVNSRHNYQINHVSIPFKATSFASDGGIESLEWIDREQFIIGVQWHPENMESMIPLYETFINQIIAKKKS